MGAVEAVVEIVKAVAWPLGVVIVAIVLREVFTSRLSEVEGFGWKAKFDRAAASAERAADDSLAESEQDDLTDAADGVESGASASVASPQLPKHVYETAERSPVEAILFGYSKLVDSLENLLRNNSVPFHDSMSGPQLVLAAAREGLAPDSVVRSVRELSDLRNFVVHNGERVTPAEATKFLSAVDDVIFGLNGRRRRSVKRFDVFKGGSQVAHSLPASAAFRLVAAGVIAEVGEDQVLSRLSSTRVGRSASHFSRPKRTRRIADDAELWHTTQLNQADYLEMVDQLSDLVGENYSVLETA